MIHSYLKPDQLAFAIGSMMDGYDNDSLSVINKQELYIEIVKSYRVLANGIGWSEAWEMISSSDEFPINRRKFWFVEKEKWM